MLLKSSNIQGGGEGIRDYARSIRSGANVQCLENDPTHLYHMKPQQSRFIYIFRWHIKLLCHETKSVARLGRFPHSVFFFKSSSNQSSYAYLICTLSEPLIFRLSGKDVFATDLNISRIFFFLRVKIMLEDANEWKTEKGDDSLSEGRGIDRRRFIIGGMECRRKAAIHLGHSRSQWTRANTLQYRWKRPTIKVESGTIWRFVHSSFMILIHTEFCHQSRPH